MPDIPFWNQCNNKCVMCTNTPSFARQGRAEYRLRGQVNKLERYLNGLGPGYLKNADKPGFVSLTGGEPTLHPEFIQLVAYFKKRLPGVPVTLLSNGRRFADPAFAARFAAVATGPFCVAIAMHVPSAKTHDAVAGVRGAFAQTVRGLRNLMALRSAPRVEIRLVLHRMNIAGFSRTLEFLLREFPDTSRYSVTAIHYEIEGMSLKNRAKLELKLADSARAVNAALPLIRRFGDLRLYHFPLCLVRRELRGRCRITLPPEDRVYPPACGACRLKKKCLGLMAEYFKRFGAAELAPVKR
jgi:MoaA/NifB/PqqE/SkfB family radical SAM enzyme